MKRIKGIEEKHNVRFTSVNESKIKRFKKLGLIFALVGSLGACSAAVIYTSNDPIIVIDLDGTEDETIPTDPTIENETDDNIIDDKESDVINEPSSDIEESETSSNIDNETEEKEESKIDDVVTPVYPNHNHDNKNNGKDTSTEKPDKPDTPIGVHKHDYGDYKYNPKSGNEVAYCKTCGHAIYRKCDMTEWSVKNNIEERHCKHGCGHKEERPHEHMHTISTTPVIETIYGEATRCHSEYYVCTSPGCPDGGKVNVHDVGHTFGPVYEVYVGFNTYDQYQKCTVCGYAKCVGTVVHTPSSNPTPSNPTPSNPDPTPSNPNPTNPDPTPSNPEPTTPDPTTQDPTTNIPDPEPTTPDPTVPSVPDPTNSVPEPGTSIPDPIEISSLRTMKDMILNTYISTDMYAKIDDNKNKTRQA